MDQDSEREGLENVANEGINSHLQVSNALAEEIVPMVTRRDLTASRQEGEAGFALAGRRRARRSGAWLVARPDLILSTGIANEGLAGSPVSFGTTATASRSG